MKRTTTIILSAIILMSVMFNVFASSVSNRVYADAITIEAGEQITIPVRIENNDGFMGFSVIVTYDKNVFTPVSVSKGSMLSGMFNDSIATSVNNSFKVVFTGTSNVTADGELFNIVFDVADNVSGKFEIELSYSQQDTFNENWDNVAFSCDDIEVIVTENGTTAATSESATQATTFTTTEPTTKKQQNTTEPSTTELATTEPSAEETTTQPAAEPTTKKQQNTTEPSITEPATTEHSIEETTTQPVTEPSAELENDEKPLSVRMREWVNGLPFPLNIILGIFVIPVAFFVSIFE